MGVIHLVNIVKDGMKNLPLVNCAMGIRSVMITGDNPLTAAAIAQEAGVDDFLAEATPADKLDIKQEQTGGRLVAMTGYAPTTRRHWPKPTSVFAMNTGTTAAKRPATWWTSTATRPS